MANVSPKLRTALNSEETGELDSIIQERSPSDLDELRQLVSTDPEVDPMHRRRAIYALGRWRDQASVPQIINILPSLDEKETITAVDALGRLGTPEATGAARSLAEHESPQVRKFVVKALGRSADPEAQDTLAAIAANDPADFVRSSARELTDQ